MRISIVLALVCLALGSTATAAQSCTPIEIRSAINEVKAIQTSLLAFKLRDEMDEQVPAPLQAQITQFKTALAGYSDLLFACSQSSAEPGSLQSTMARQLDANNPEPTQQIYDPNKPLQLDHIYGDSLHVKVAMPSEIPKLRLVEFSFEIGCGKDSLLIAYEQRADQWKRVLQWQSPPYDSVDQSFGDFFVYTALPQPGTNNWLLAVAHGHPWCTSRWSSFNLDLLQPMSSPQNPSVLQHINHGYVRFEVEPVLKSVPGGFQLRLETGMIDTDIMTRIGIYRYRLTGTEFERVQPIANNGRDFVDEWLQSPWSEAAKWSSPTNLTALKQIHSEIHEDQNSGSANTFYNFGPVLRCADSRQHFQVELDQRTSDGKGKLQPGEPTWFHIQQGSNSFTMLDSAYHKDSRCSGPDIMPRQ
jgi:hypothetical protein